MKIVIYNDTKEAWWEYEREKGWDFERYKRFSEKHSDIYSMYSDVMRIYLMRLMYCENIWSSICKDRFWGEMSHRVSKQTIKDLSKITTITTTAMTFQP